jgi:hypothetical protein
MGEGVMLVDLQAGGRGDWKLFAVMWLGVLCRRREGCGGSFVLVGGDLLENEMVYYSYWLCWRRGWFAASSRRILGRSRIGWRAEKMCL